MALKVLYVWSNHFNIISIITTKQTGILHANIEARCDTSFAYVKFILSSNVLYIYPKNKTTNHTTNTLVRKTGIYTKQSYVGCCGTGKQTRIPIKQLTPIGARADQRGLDLHHNTHIGVIKSIQGALNVVCSNYCCTKWLLCVFRRT